MEYGDELYAERLRRKAQAEALGTGATQWTDDLEAVARLKLKLAWTDAVSVIGPDDRARLTSGIKRRTLRSLGRALEPDNMEAVVVNDGGYRHSSEDLLSLVEAEHEALKQFVDSRIDPWGGPALRSGATGFGFGDPTVDADAFRANVNRILEAHLVAFHLHDNSRLVPVASQGLDPVCWTRSIPGMSWGKRDDPTRWQGKVIPISSRLTRSRCTGTPRARRSR